MKKILYLLILLVHFYNGHAQNLSITGKVINSANSQPLSGVKIISKKTGKETLSGNNGAFHIVATTIDTLSITYFGFKKLIVSINSVTQVPIIIALEVASLQLDEVVINTGYQTLAKERSTGSFTSINNNRLNEQIGTDILSRLESIGNSILTTRKTGGNGAQIMIRGLSTIQGVKEPLIIVDNFSYDGNINNINPNDVQDITILKDASAASIWGTKAGNGVIVITTKKGMFNQKVNVDFNLNSTVINKPDLFYLSNISSRDFIEMERMLFNKEYRFSDTISKSNPPFSPVYELLFKHKNGKISAAEVNKEIDALSELDVRNDYNKYLYKNGNNQQYALTINGGSNNIAWLFSGGYDKNSNELSAEYSRINFRTQNTFSPARNLKITLSAYYTETKEASGKPTYSEISNSAGNVPPYTQIADENGHPLAVTKNYRKTYIDVAGGGKLLDWNYYPLTDFQNSRKNTTREDILANIGLQYRITNGFVADIKYQYEKQQVVTNGLQDINSYYTRDLINRFSQINQITNTVINIVPKGGIMDLSTGNIHSENIRAQLNFDKSIHKFDFNAIVGGEVKERTFNQNSYRQYGYNSDILTTIEVDYANPYPTFIQGTKSYIPSNVSMLNTSNRFVSTFANLALSYNEKYILSLSGRTDASNIFGISTNNRWQPLWSSGLSWDISLENFFNNLLIPFLKLRVTYGISGNVNPDATAVTTIAYGSTSIYTQTPTAAIDKFFNPDLRWEKVGMLNFGIDFRVFRNKLSGSIEYYNKNSTDLFGRSPVDYTVGLSTPTIIKNVASMIGNGVDVELNSINIDRKFRWLTNLNFSYYKDKVTQYYLATAQGSNFINGGYLISGIVGKPVYSIFSYKWAGLDPKTGDPQGILKGQLSKDYLSITGSGTTIDDLKYNGSAFPVFFGSMGNTISFNNISITARVLYKFGYYFQKQSINYSSLFANSKGHTDYQLRWQHPGDELTTSVPSMSYPINASRDSFYNGSEVLIESGDHIRLQYLNIGYDILKNSDTKSSFNKIQAYIVFSNLGIIWKASKTNADPDYNSSVIPPSKSVSIGIKTSF